MFILSDMQKEIRDLTKKIAEDELKKKVKAVINGTEETLEFRRFLDETHTYPREFLRTLANAGILSIFIPEEFGGLGQGVTSLCAATEELARVDPAASTVYAVNGLGIMPIWLSGTEEQKKKYLTKVASGDWCAAFALTEPNAGSDAFSLSTKAARKGDVYVLDGEKRFTTSGGEADFYTVFAVTDPSRGRRGISCFIVEKGTPGLSFGKPEKKMGLNCSRTSSLFFSNCEVPAENLLGGTEGIGAIVALNTLNRSRIGIGAQSVGAAQGAFEIARDYAKMRKQFNQPIIDFQVIGHKLAEMEMQIEAARALVYKAAWYSDNGEAAGVEHIKDVIAKFGKMAKCFGSEMVQKVTYDAIQIIGGYGYVREYLVEKFYRDVRIFTIYEGTSEMQKNEIVEILVKDAGRRPKNLKKAAVPDLLEAKEEVFYDMLLKEKENESFGQRMKHRFAELAMKLEAAKALQEKAAELADGRLMAIALRFAEEVSEEISTALTRIRSGYYAEADKATDGLVEGLKNNS
jgi:alkylation response protein AidB-like acyl-CoA dehydrogenase